MTAWPAPYLAWACGACGRIVRGPSRPHACYGCGAPNALTKATPEQLDAHASRQARARPLRLVGAPSAGGSSLPWAPEAPEAAGPPAGLAWASSAKVETVERARTGWAPWAAVTNELPRRRVALVTGPRGAGKTRLVVQVAAAIARIEQRNAVISTGEQSVTEIAELVGAVAGPEVATRIGVLPTRKIEEAFAAALHTGAVLLVLDGIQTFTFAGEVCRGGSRALSSAMDAIVGFAAAHDLAIVVIPHMQGNGEQVGGGAVVQQLCHVIVRLWPVEVAEDAGDDAPSLVRLGCDGKNRHGPVNVRRTLRWTTLGTLVDVREGRQDLQ